ncbi:hypothetical protein XM38_014470 [Halomicronema hongdechloris C2206]|uniref:Uncharacterized protein n=1 Tax=Halomicronema hongdechloris C2206 TaxID=1641165 RepID=A0A1Z3HJM8_9CYAN|nr:zinc ribbon domain-containing protein [Halomicronema hongdechloris]ASC70508.1 hypothetical protein XM38_014470 [Halomicronema hongdechloris C2206]
MTVCPRCQTRITPGDIHCPTCRLPLKAYGHPGMTLHRATDGMPLCDRCTYHQDDTCTFPQRPHAQTCILFRDMATPVSPPTVAPPVQWRLQSWLRRHSLWVGLLALLGLSLLISLT